MAELYLVEFRGSRKEFFYNSYYHNFHLPEYVIVQAERGEDIGMVSHLVDKEMDFPDDNRPRSILRPANDDDLGKFKEQQNKERQFRGEIIKMIAGHGLPMKVVDVELQYDGNKLTVYFTADHRVDFRELVKDMASRYRTRIELRQIGVRDEARRCGGYGVCGLRQCCCTFIRDFAPISTQQAREQDLPLNPAKISGNCGRLLCCLRYEVDMYTGTRAMFPPPGTHIETKLGPGVVDRVDIFSQEAVVYSPDDQVYFRCRAKDILNGDEEKKGDQPEGKHRDDRPRRSNDDGETVSDDELKKLEDENE